MSGGVLVEWVDLLDQPQGIGLAASEPEAAEAAWRDLLASTQLVRFADYRQRVRLLPPDATVKMVVVREFDDDRPSRELYAYRTVAPARNVQRVLARATGGTYTVRPEVRS